METLQMPHAKRLYRAFICWADGMQAGGLSSGKLLYALGAVPCLGSPLFGRWWTILSIALAAAWIIFLLWRLYVMARTGYIGGSLAQLRNGEHTDADRQPLTGTARPR